MRILGIDPGLQKTGWGIIETTGHRLAFISCGLIKTQAAMPLAARLAVLDREIEKIILQWKPAVSAVEQTFMNNNPASALKLGQARGVCLVAPARQGINVYEYAANLVKKSLVGSGHASKDQIGVMIRHLLPKAGKLGEDEADALAIAICHAHHAQTARNISAAPNYQAKGG